MASSIFHRLLSFFFLILLLHFGCFVFTTAAEDAIDGKLRGGTNRRYKKRKLSPLISSSWSFVKGLFTSKSCKTSIQTHPYTPPCSSQHSIASPVVPEMKNDRHLTNNVVPWPESNVSSAAVSVSSESRFFPLYNDIFPCTTCGEIFKNPQALEQHQAIKHAVSELIDGEGISAKNIVRIIFEKGWADTQKSPIIHRILKIHNSAKTLSGFEEYREAVKAKAALSSTVRTSDERCIADGNELLRFQCCTFLCSLGRNGNSSICNDQNCSACRIIKSGFSPELDGISMLSNSWRAHVAIPEDVEGEVGFMDVKRAMLVCRVVAGRVWSKSDGVDKEEGDYDSVLGRGGKHEEELLVFNPSAVLPCFVIVYTP